jgi:hypothetical protein
MVEKDASLSGDTEYIAHGPPPLLGGSPAGDQDDDESDDDASINTNEGHSGHESGVSQDTVPPTVSIHETGESYYDDQQECLCRLSQKVDGEFILCGWPLDACTRPMHHTKSQNPINRGVSGYYITTWNAGKKVLDAIESSLVTE